MIPTKTYVNELEEKIWEMTQLLARIYERLPNAGGAWDDIKEQIRSFTAPCKED